MAATAHAFADGAVCSVQNGAGNEELVAEHVREVIRGTTFPAGHVIEPGHVGWDTKGDTHIGPFEPSPAPMDDGRGARRCVHARRDADACARGRARRPVAQADLQRRLERDRRADRPDARPGRRAADPRARLGGDGGRRAVADAQGITLDMSPEELFDHAARKDVAYGHKPSMLQDVEAGRETEIDFLNGAIVAFGERYGVDAPLNRALTALVKGKEQA